MPTGPISEETIMKWLRLLSILALGMGCDTPAGSPDGGCVSSDDCERDTDACVGGHCVPEGTDGGTLREDARVARPDGGPGPEGSCFPAGVRPESVAPFGFAMPSADDERATYERLGWTWAPTAEPSYPADPDFEMNDPDNHYGLEADDLWTSLAMYQRTGERGYLDRASAWRRYFVEDYVACNGTESYTFCWDRDSFGADHLFGWGLISWNASEDDAEALAQAVSLGAEVEALWGPDSTYGCLPRGACTWYGLRQAGRHLLFATRLAEATGDARWIALRDHMIDLLLASEDWDEERGMYFYGDWGTDEHLGAGAYASGDRVQSTFQIGIFGEAFDHAYRVTGNEEIRRRMVAMARFVEQYGLDETYRYSSSYIGVVDGAPYQSYAAEEPVTYWDPVYTTALVNTLVRGYRYTCEPHFFEAAAEFFMRGNGGRYGEPIERDAPDGVVHHFVDTIFDSSTGNALYAYNKGELQYTYLLFDPLRHP
jgi:hypothetical protein